MFLTAIRIRSAIQQSPAGLLLAFYCAVSRKCPLLQIFITKSILLPIVSWNEWFFNFKITSFSQLFCPTSSPKGWKKETKVKKKTAKYFYNLLNCVYEILIHGSLHFQIQAWFVSEPSSGCHDNDLTKWHMTLTSESTRAGYRSKKDNTSTNTSESYQYQ